MIIFNALGTILGSIIFIYCWVIFIQAILSIAQANPYSQFMQILSRLTDPAYNFIRRMVRANFNGLDFAPFILIILLQFINLTLVRFLQSL